MSERRSAAPQAVQDALNRLPDSAWTRYEVTEDYVRSYTMIDIGGVMTRAERTQYLADDLLQRANADDFNDSHGKRWGDGRVVARIPMNKIFQSEFADKLRAGDRDFTKWWLNSEAARPFRTFKGRI